MTLDAAPGLRERKRLATRRAIQLAVLDLASDRGLDKTTVDEISRIADISPRTFFNYFATKEEALVGDGPSLPDAAFIERFVTAGPQESIAHGLGVMLTAATASSVDDHEMTYRRRAILRDHPQLFALRMASMKSFEADLAEVISRRLMADRPEGASTPDRIASDAHLLAAVAFGTLRHAWSCWADDESLHDLATRVTAAFADLENLLSKP